jgi:UDP-2-acetamido-2,6-beta-L-arabino-hexul-4-ose reductase
MLKVGITGINGFLGWHTRISLYSRGKMDIHGADRETFADPAKLGQFVASCDVIIHCAGMNRGEDKEVASTNIRLTEMLISACERMNVKPHVVFPSSISRSSGWRVEKLRILY